MLDTYNVCKVKIGLYKILVLIGYFELLAWSILLILPLHYQWIFFAIWLILITFTAISIILFSMRKNPFSSLDIVTAIFIKFLLFSNYIFFLVAITSELSPPSKILDVILLRLLLIICLPIFYILALHVLLVSDSINKSKKWSLCKNWSISNKWCSKICLIAFTAVMYIPLLLNLKHIDPIKLMGLGDSSEHFIVNNGLKSVLAQAIPYSQSKSPSELNDKVDKLMRSLNYDPKFNMISPWVVLNSSNLVAISCGRSAAYTIVFSENPYKLVDVVPGAPVRNSDSNSCEEYNKIMNASS